MPRVFLADLCHGGHNVKTFPYGIGSIAAYAKAEIGDQLQIELFRSAEQLAEAVLTQPPDVVGFSNYTWNGCLSLRVAQQVADFSPNTVIVFGGPNYPQTAVERRAFLSSNRQIDFYLPKEGEKSFCALLSTLAAAAFDANGLRASGRELIGTDYLRGETLISGALAEKIADLDSLPSPYLSGIFDHFFEQGYAPLMQFRRGCPFSCSFCDEGQDYFSKLGQGSNARFIDELIYIAERVKGDPTLYLADANFGMYPADVELCGQIAEVRDRLGWPNMVNASTGKAHPQRVLAAAEAARGILRFGASLQSTDAEVLANIKRRNISTETLLEIAGQSQSQGSTSFSELILNLPGDSVEAHLTSIETVVNAGITRIQMYPLLLLRGTLLDSAEARERFGMQTKYRILPRCFGEYRFGERPYTCGEISEIVVASNTMSFDDYLYCKEFQLTVELFYNDAYFAEVRGLLQHLGVSMFDFVRACHDLKEHFPSELAQLYAGFRQSACDELWDSAEELQRFISDPQNLTEYARVEHRNSLATNRAIGIMTCAGALHQVARRSLRRCLEQSGQGDPLVLQYAEELLQFSLLAKRDLLQPTSVYDATFNFDLKRGSDHGFAVDPRSLRLEQPKAMRFWHERETAERIDRLYGAYDDPIMGMRNVLYHSMVETTSSFFRRSDYLSA
ncbi:MAG: cobalamin B12-binding domain-containing protein [Deltaproteobacteria bacterium]|nr:cobalamin B12-binding domain-containing protein [Deltaproteobacteria bacterium]